MRFMTFARLTFALAVAAFTPEGVAQDLDTVVVTAGRTEQRLINAPAATTVTSAATIKRTPAENIGDLLRNVPGLNVAQTSVRDFDVTARGATKTLANSPFRSPATAAYLWRHHRAQDHGPHGFRVLRSDLFFRRVGCPALRGTRTFDQRGLRTMNMKRSGLRPSLGSVADSV